MPNSVIFVQKHVFCWNSKRITKVLLRIHQGELGTTCMTAMVHEVWLHYTYTGHSTLATVTVRVAWPMGLPYNIHHGYSAPAIT